MIVHHDAQLEHAVERCATGGFSYAGQSCISVQRILVHEEVHLAFTEMLVQSVGKLKVGDPLDESTDVGPMIRESDAMRAEVLDRRGCSEWRQTPMWRRAARFSFDSRDPYRNDACNEGEL